MPRTAAPAILQASESGAYTRADLAKLTVQQLKALCKERKISGYSKLDKQALVQKLADDGLYPPSGSTVAPSVPAGSQSHPVPMNTSAAEDSPVLGSTHATTDNSAPRPSPIPAVSPSVVRRSNSRCTVPNTSSRSEARKARVTPAGITVNPPSAPCQVSAARQVSSLTSDRSHVLPSKRTRPSTETMPPPLSKLPRIAPPMVVDTSVSIPSAPPRSRQTSLGMIPTSNAPGNALPKSDLVIPPKRFRPLVVDKNKLSAASAPTASQLNGTIAALGGGAGLAGSSEVSLASLEEFVASAPTLGQISMPPSLVQRKRVHRWAIILSGLSNKERAACVLVSRAIRYAVYLSASCILTRDYGGRRLREGVLQKYSQAMTNMWPYLRVRETEATQRIRLYEASFIARFFRRCGVPNPIAKRLWTSPDNPRQLMIAVRFVVPHLMHLISRSEYNLRDLQHRFALTRAWFELSLGTPPHGKDYGSLWLHGTIMDVNEVVRGEIWSVHLTYPSSADSRRSTYNVTLYVLEATCEVIGGDDTAGPPAFPVRADWSAYIASRVKSKSTDRQLISYVKWASREEYDRGMSKLWLKRIAAEGSLGELKLAVAERYVLACVVGNSISGQWKTTNEMAQEFASLPERVTMPRNAQAPKLSLYLPEHHHIESVHFTSGPGVSLHPALAVVQTPHREYIILRDNGMQVGCEEEGVAPVWREVLHCDQAGVSL